MLPTEGRSCTSLQIVDPGPDRDTGRPFPVDSRRSLLVFGCSFVAHLVIFGVAYSTGVLYMALLDDLDTAPGLTAVPFAVNSGTVFAACPIGAVICQYVGPRATILIGAVVSTSGLVLSSFVGSVIHLLLTFGVATGVGWAISYSMLVTTLEEYFSARFRRSALLGVAVASGLGSCFYPYVMLAFIEAYHWRGAFLLLGGLNLHMLLSAVIMRSNRAPPTDKPEPLLGPTDDDAPRLKQIGVSRCASVLQLFIFKDPQFLSTLANHLLFTGALSITMTHLANYAHWQGHSSASATTLVAIVGITNTVCRLLTTVIVQRSHGDAVFLIYATGHLLYGGVAMMTGLASDLDWLIALSVGLGMFSSCYVISPEVIYLTSVRADFTIGYSYIMAACGSAMMVGPPIAGWLLETTATYLSSFLLSGAMAVAGGMTMVAVWYLRRRNAFPTSIEEECKLEG